MRKDVVKSYIERDVPDLASYRRSSSIGLEMIISHDAQPAIRAALAEKDACMEGLVSIIVTL